MLYRVAVLHLKLKIMAKKSNMEKIKRHLITAKSMGANIAVLPSLFNVGPIFEYYKSRRLEKAVKNGAERIPGPVSEYLVALAIDLGMFILGGPILERAGPKVFLSSIAISPRGIMLGKFRKMVKEPLDSHVTAGKKPAILEIGRPIGILAEGELLYPEIARTLAVKGATCMIALPRISNRYRNIDKVATTRSMENGVPVVMVGGAAETQGRIIASIPSLVAMPNGDVEVLAEEDEDTLAIYNLELDDANTLDLEDLERTSKMLYRAVRDRASFLL